jgi:hypothetical protein
MIRWIRQTETNIVELMKTYHISGNQTKGQKRAIMRAQHFLQVSSAIIDSVRSTLNIKTITNQIVERRRLLADG